MNQLTTYKKVASYEAQKKDISKVLLLYSGGLDTSTMIKWIKDTYDVKIIAVTMDLGQQEGNLEEIKQKALDLGADEAITVDVKDEFAEEFIAKGIKANASYQGDYHLSTPLARAVTAKNAVHLAHKYNADAIAHGCTGKGNDQVRFEGYILSQDPSMKIIAPVREWNMDRNEQIKYAQNNNIPVPVSHDFPYSVDDNMWGMTWEGGEIEYPNAINPIEKFLTTYTLATDAPDTGELVELEFKNGLPISINGTPMNLSALIMKANTLGGAHGVGVVQMVEDRLVGLKNGGVYELPGAHIIIEAHKALEKYVSTRQVNELKAMMDIKWAYLCYGALWFDPVMDAINAFNEDINKKVTGVVTLKLFKGSTTVVAMESPFGLHNGSFNNDEGYNFNVNASAGFTEIYSLQMKLANQILHNQN
ncbi:argininosuccinate synthase [Candidatus Dojkabacteria bacterium]|uniref:Argininosuccinate synthase n=1 Tax=Candidatus Dojkabacteria bacterium TaxID=2099670 RepID=A0A955RK46_9BACT|nr:argininosuccinate synthase [Candidatus Dojkabacteria bacterium]